MKIRKRLILIPTYNEKENVERLSREILALKLANTDVLFIDDNSPDGTGKLLNNISKKNKKIKVIHRPAKNGIGSAHLYGINWAYKHGYSDLVTMDSDFTHSPLDIYKIIKASNDYDVVVGSRYLKNKSIIGWSFRRRVLTKLGHFITKILLNLKYDASNAFRLYRLDRIPRKVFSLVTSKSYSFFLESLYILNINGLKIGEIPIKLPARIYGQSKMALKDVLKSVNLILSLYITSIKDKGKLKI
jgi:dolichol-phosphate mannosyltransferase